jgi:cytochrome c-type biogenesis protein CcmH
MIVFWLVAAVMIVIALAFVLPPLLQRAEKSNADEVKEANVAVYRDQLRELESDLHNGIVSQEQYNQDREEIERHLLQDLGDSSGDVKQSKPALTDRHLAYVLGAAIPVIAVLFYLPLAKTNERAKAQPAAEPKTEAAAAPFANQSGEMTPQAIEANVAKLAKRMEENPNDAKGWIMLARSYTQMQRYKDAADAYEHATALVSNDADLWADYALTVATINGKEMQGKPMEFVNKALAIDPLNRKALILAGEAALALKNYDLAIQYWQKLLKTLPPDSEEVARPINQKIAEAKRLAKAAPTK